MTKLQLKVGDDGKPQELHRVKKSPLAERLLCDGCAAAISDLHRTCPDCDYDLCLKCCEELRPDNQVCTKQSYSYRQILCCVVSCHSLVDMFSALLALLQQECAMQ